jgi:hypothetical protein
MSHLGMLDWHDWLGELRDLLRGPKKCISDDLTYCRSKTTGYLGRSRNRGGFYR